MILIFLNQLGPAAIRAPAGPGPTRLVGPVARKMGAQLNSLEYLKLLFPEKYSVLEFLSQFCGISFK